jgi:hypothetical protein
VVLALLVLVAVQAVALGLGATNLLRGPALAPAPASTAELGRSGEALLIAARSLSRLLATLLFLVWTVRAYRNLGPLGAFGVRTTPLGAALWFFVPLLNLVRPFQVARELWRGSDPMLAVTDGYAWKFTPASPLVAAWWLACLAAVVASLAPAILPLALPTAQGRLLPWARLAADALVLMAALLTMGYVTGVDARQEQKHQRRRLHNLQLGGATLA